MNSLEIDTRSPNCRAYNCIYGYKYQENDINMWIGLNYWIKLNWTLKTRYKDLKRIWLVN